jgi:hypothetical protein
MLRCRRKTYQRSPPAQLSKIHSLIWCFPAGRPDCRKVHLIHNFKPLVIHLILGAAVMISHGNITYALMQAVVVAQSVAQVYTVSSLFSPALMSGTHESPSASTSQYTRRYSCRARISPSAPHLRSSLLCLACLPSALHPRASQPMGH